jgi:UDP-glucose 4-epimerase
MGEWVIAELAAHGHEILAISRNPIDKPTIAGLNWQIRPRESQTGQDRRVQTAAVDLSEAGSLSRIDRARAKIRAVVHLAAHVPAETARNADEDADTTLRANAVGTVRLLQWLAEAEKLESVTYASTFEVYGAAHASPIDESHPTEPLNYYGASKLAGEKYLRIFGKDRKLPCASLRLPAIYGPGDKIRRAIGNFIRAAAARKSIEIQGDGEDLRELVYAGDAARAVALAIQHRADGPFNIASGRGISIREMAEAAKRAAGGEIEVVMSPRVKPRLDYTMAIDRAKAAFGWSPATSLDEGVRAQLDWVRRAQEPRP